MKACANRLGTGASVFGFIGRSALMVNDLRLTTYFWPRKIRQVRTTMIAASAAAKLAWPPISLTNSE